MSDKSSGGSEVMVAIVGRVEVARSQACLPLRAPSTILGPSSARSRSTQHSFRQRHSLPTSSCVHNRLAYLNLRLIDL